MTPERMRRARVTAEPERRRRAPLRRCRRAARRTRRPLAHLDPRVTAGWEVAAVVVVLAVLALMYEAHR